MVSGPYAEGVIRTRRAGWRGVIPLSRVDGKLPAVAGYTGHNGVWPTEEQVHEWIRTHGDRNLGVRVPRDVIGVDLDDYDDKPGARTLAELEARYGKLPPTYRSSSRSWPSGIYWYQAPEDVKLATKPGPGIEIVQFHHRHAVVWPSIHHKTRAIYQWYRPDGELAPRPPTRYALAELPIGWIRGQAKRQIDEQPADLPAAQEHRERSWHLDVRQRFHQAIRDMDAGHGRYDTTRDAVMRFARMEQQRLPGSTAAIDALTAEYLRRVRDDRASPEIAQHEATKIVDSARHRARTTKDPYAPLQVSSGPARRPLRATSRAARSRR